MSRVRFADWVLAPPWSEQRMLALKVLALHDLARVSAIFGTSMMPPTVWRETALWLAERDLVEIANDGLSSTVQLSEMGRSFVRILDAQERA